MHHVTDQFDEWACYMAEGLQLRAKYQRDFNLTRAVAESVAYSMLHDWYYRHPYLVTEK